MTRTRCPDHPGWDQVRFTCFHGHKGHLRGERAVVDEWARVAASNPCKLIECPERVKPMEER